MKHYTPWLRAISALSLLAITSLLLSFVVAEKLSDDVWRQLGISQQDGMDKIKKSFLDSYIHREGLHNLKSIAGNDRAAIANGLLAYTRQTVSSPAFKAAYEKMRLDARPSAPNNNTRTKEQIRQDMIESTKKGIKGTEELIQKMPDQKKTFESVLEMHKKNLAAYQQPNNELIEQMYQGEVMQHKQELENFDKHIAEWNARYPIDVKPFVRARLQAYLDLAKTVDFSATLIEKNGKMYFSNKDYQYKSNDWKMIYRAGKEVYDATRTYVDNWMKEL